MKQRSIRFGLPSVYRFFSLLLPSRPLLSPLYVCLCDTIHSSCYKDTSLVFSHLVPALQYRSRPANFRPTEERMGGAGRLSLIASQALSVVAGSID